MDFHRRFIEPIYHLLFISYITSQYIAPGIIAVAIVFSTYFLSPIISDALENTALRIAISVAIALIFLVFFRRNSAERNATRRIADQISRCIEAHIIFKMEVGDALKTRMAPGNKQRLVSEKVTHHCINLCSRLAEIFQILTNSKCHVSAKSLSQNTVITRARDALSHNSDREYP